MKNEIEDPMPYNQFDYRRIALKPLHERQSKFSVGDILVDPDTTPQKGGKLIGQLDQIADAMRCARKQGAAVILAYGAHMVKNGLGPVVSRLMEEGWVTHLATNGAGTIHDWEYAFQGRSEEDVRANVAQGCFGTWDETGRNIHLAVLCGALEGMGYGESLGRFIIEDGCYIPDKEVLLSKIKAWAGDPVDDPVMPAVAEMLQVLTRFDIPSGPYRVSHAHKDISLTAEAYRHGVPLTVHPGIGYDIIYNHHLANGAAIGRGADIDYRVFVDSMSRMDEGVFLSVGSAIMAPQIFEKALSLANNQRFQKGEGVIQPHIVVNDLVQVDWDWSRGEPPKDNPAYYLRFCKSFSRMGGDMTYLGCDNRLFLHNLYHLLRQT